MDPLQELQQIASESKLSIEDIEYAKMMDTKDPLREFRSKFEYPTLKSLPHVDKKLIENVSEDEECIYLCGNSLGLMPKGARECMTQVFDQWGQMGVYGHHVGDRPWYICDEQLIESMCKLVGAKSTDEIAIMNQLTSNLHFLLISFYQPKQNGGRYKIIFEAGAFPSDHYTFESQVKLHGYDPEDALVLLKPRNGEYTLRTEDIEAVIRKEGDKVAVVCLSGVQYYSGQLFDIKHITKVTKEIGAYSGWDLAHAVGSVELKLHEWDIDFAVWTTYKYLNSGAGNTGVAFLHERLFDRTDLPHLYGWWGHCIETRMDMSNQIKFGKGIRKYRMSTPSAIHCAVLRASLQLFDATDMTTILHKAHLQIRYFEYLLTQLASQLATNDEPLFKIITPANPDSRGCQLSLMFQTNVQTIHEQFKLNGLVCDERKPNVLRLALSPLYSSYMDAYKACQLLKKVLMNK